MVSFTVSETVALELDSRLIIYLNVADDADNNLSDTVLKMFKVGVSEYGIPKIVRGESGVETVRVRDFMVEQLEHS